MSRGTLTELGDRGAPASAGRAAEFCEFLGAAPQPVG